MRQHLANLLLAMSLGGCSLLYNPADIPTHQDAIPDQPYDAPTDSNPALLALTAARPAVIYEGQGTGGSRPAILVIEGSSMVKNNTTVTITPSTPVTKTPKVTVDNTKLDVSADGLYLAVPLTLDVDRPPTGLAASDSIKLDVTVTQMGPGGPVTKTLPMAVTVQGLAEAEGAALGAGYPVGSEQLFSIVNLNSTTIVKAAATTEPLQIRSVSSLQIDAKVDVNGSLRNGGPGGGTGGVGAAVLGSGGNGTGPMPGLAPMGAGGFTTDPILYTLASPFRGSGGGGGVNALGGGDGGGGGGSVMLTAGGNLKVGLIEAKAGAFTTGAQNGGGGSGGVIVLRAGASGTLMGGTMDVLGTGTGAAGRVRYDAGAAVTLANAATSYRGAQFVDPPLIATDDHPMLSVAGQRSTAFRYFITNGAGTVTNGPFTGNIPDSGPATITFLSSTNDRLFGGLNKVCLVVGPLDSSSDTKNCVEIANISH